MQTKSRHRQQAAILREALAWMYEQGWASGTGGGLCIRAEGTSYYGPSGVHKEAVQEHEVFVDTGHSCAPISEREDPARLTDSRVSECKPIFDRILTDRTEGAVLHSHSTYAVLAANFLREPSRRLSSCANASAANDEEDESILLASTCRQGWFVAQELEMLKGLTGYGYRSVYSAPVIANTAREVELVASISRVFRWGDLAVLIKDHGVYVWGVDWPTCKRHAEVLHWLFEYEYRKAALGA